MAEPCALNHILVNVVQSRSNSNQSKSFYVIVLSTNKMEFIFICNATILNHFRSNNDRCISC